MGIYYVDGTFVDESDATVSVKDIAILRGFGVFDFLRTYKRRPFHLADHVTRFRNSAKLIGLEIKESDAEIADAVQKTLDQNSDLEEANIRFLYTGGVSSDGVSPEGNGKLIVMVTPKHGLPDSWYTDGAKVCTVDSERFIPGSKSINYLGAVMAQQEAKKENGIEAIYVDRNNRILEGTTTNIFFFKGNEIHTPKDTILPGITRSVILKLAETNFKVIERDINKDEIGDFEEVMITASNKEVVPVIAIDDVTIGSGKVGPSVSKMMTLFRDYTTKYGKNQIH